MANVASRPANQISQRTINRVTSAVKNVVDLYKAGEAPNAALTKVAIQYDLSPDLTRLVGRGFNSGQTNVEIQSGRTLAEKTAGARKLIDIESVVQDLFTTKTARQDNSQTTASLYLQDPRGQMGKAASADEKAQIICASEETKPAPIEIWQDPSQFDAKQKTAFIVELRHTLKDLDRAESLAKQATLRANAVLREEMSRYLKDTQKMAELRSDARRFHGQEGLDHFNRTLATFGGRFEIEQLRKHAETATYTTRTLPSIADHPLILKIGACCEACKAEESAKKSRLHGRMMGAKLHRMVLGKDEPSKALSKTAETRVDRATEHLEKFAINVGALVGGMIGGRARLQPGIDPSSLSFREAEMTADDPSHDQNLKNIRLRASLQSLLDYDPIIQSYDPDEVLIAFNELSQSAPSAIDNPVFLSSNLRRLLQGDIAPHESQQLHAIESQNRKLINPVTPQ